MSADEHSEPGEMSAPLSPPSPPFHTRYGFSRPRNRDISLVIEPYPEICDRGVLRPAILASAIDLVASLFVREIAGLDATFTGDLSLRAPRRDIPERIEVRGRILRAGKRLITTAVELSSADSPFAYGESTFTRIERRGERPPDAGALRVPDVIERHPLTRPLAEEVGIEILEPAIGRIRLPLRAALRNPEGILQGALVALMVETAALALADAEAETRSAAAPRAIVSELDLRYLAAARIGPVEGEAHWIGSPGHRMIRIELRDAGQQGRLTTSALARVADAPPIDLAIVST